MYCIMYWTKITMRIVLIHIFISVSNESGFYLCAIVSPAILHNSEQFKNSCVQLCTVTQNCLHWKSDLTAEFYKCEDLKLNLWT